ncbi:OmpA family protein [Cerasicoccus frondis]|uniref:OmpA family protein n=1 Tax=Cerasicoccus frondis TaxID=490090 RepID=UPI0028528014|nr:OmpA family protein [Cerasicoccus frondis]
MSRVFNFAFVSLFAVLLFSGCSDTEPKPEDTVLGQPNRPNGGNGFINEADIAGAGGAYSNNSWNDDGLSDRNDFNGGMGDGMNGPQNVMDSVYFGFDQYSIPAAERSKVDAAADYLRSNPGARLIAEGHTDAIGTSEYNNGLSDRRANSVKTYLEQLGIDGGRVEVLAMGELQADQSATKGSAASSQDRRVDLITVQ